MKLNPIKGVIIQRKALDQNILMVPFLFLLIVVYFSAEKHSGKKIKMAVSW